MRRAPVPSLVYMSSALPAFGKHSTRHLHAQAHRLHGASIHGRWTPQYRLQALLGLTSTGKHCKAACGWALPQGQHWACLGRSQAVLLSVRPGNHLLKSSWLAGKNGADAGPTALPWALICSPALHMQTCRPPSEQDTR